MQKKQKNSQVKTTEDASTSPVLGFRMFRQKHSGF